MIYTFYEQLVMIIYFIILGMFMSIMLDTIHTLFNKIRITHYLLQIITWVLISIVCIKSVDRISNGYIPIYIFMFFLIGYVIYSKLFSKRYIKIILKIKTYKQNIILAIFPITLYNYIIRNIKRILKRKKKNEENNCTITNSNNDVNNTGL